MITTEFVRRLRALRVSKSELAIAIGRKPYYLSAILSQERLDDQEANEMLATAIRLFDERIATFTS